jgi:aldose 1-epimerase
MNTIEPHILENEIWQVGVLPPMGMSTAFGRIKHGGRWCDFLRRVPEAGFAKASECASYLLVPWSNRIRDARFKFRGKDYQLKVNAVDGTAMHGTAKDYAWDVEQADERSIVGSFDSRRNEEVNFPFAFSARAEFRLDGARFVNRVSIKNEGGEPMPAGVGHHPYFQRALTSDTDTVLLEVPCKEHFPLEKCLPTSEPVPIESRIDFRTRRPLGTVPIDDCLTTREGDAPVRFSYLESGVAVSLELDAIFENIVVYVPPGKPFFAVEPVTNANDGFNLYDKQVRGSGVFVLEPGEERTATFVIAFER